MQTAPRKTCADKRRNGCTALIPPPSVFMPRMSGSILTQGFDSNHINPPLGTVGVSGRQALSQPLCCLGSAFGLHRSCEREQERNGDKRMTAKHSEMSLCSFCMPFAEMPGSGHRLKLLHRAKFIQLDYTVCV